MARRIHLHIGTMKSGTTYLQQLCTEHRERLLESGVLWPISARYQAVRDLFGWPWEGDPSPSEWRALTKEMRQHPGDVILSNELISLLSDRRLERLVKALPAEELYVVITARDLGRGLPSQWQTSVKNGNRQGWEEFALWVCRDVPLDDAEQSDGQDPGGREGPASVHERFWRKHDVASLIHRSQRFVPAQRITLVTVPPQGGDPALLVERFGAAVGVDLATLEPAEYEGNPSLGAHSAELMRRLNQTLSSDQLAERLYGLRIGLGRRSLAPRAGSEPAYGLSQEQLDWLTARVARMIDEIESTGVVVQGDVQDLRPSSTSVVPGVDPGVTSETDLLAAAADGLLGMAKVLGDLKGELDEAVAAADAASSERDQLRLRLDRKKAKRAKKSKGSFSSVARPARD